jgi:hypothetical protein
MPGGPGSTFLNLRRPELKIPWNSECKDSGSRANRGTNMARKFFTQDLRFFDNRPPPAPYEGWMRIPSRLVRHSLVACGALACAVALAAGGYYLGARDVSLSRLNLDVTLFTGLAREIRAGGHEAALKACEQNAGASMTLLAEWRRPWGPVSLTQTAATVFSPGLKMLSDSKPQIANYAALFPDNRLGAKAIALLTAEAAYAEGLKETGRKP